MNMGITSALLTIVKSTSAHGRFSLFFWVMDFLDAGTMDGIAGPVGDSGRSKRSSDT